ncbi:Sensor histidine kinase DesK [Alphaproteobacteria bacterium SO-S41]|nr:Sensor histidine kinase DesK [Alphaproteobacteria bacterium SO-S41]
MTLPHHTYGAPPPERGLWPRVKAAMAPDGPYLWLVYLPIYGITWFWLKPTFQDLVLTAAALPLFLLLYIKGHAATKHGALALPWIACLMVLGFTLAMSTSGNWSVIAVYAFALAGALRPQRLAFVTLAAIAVSIIAFGVIFKAPLSLTLIALFFGLVVAVANFFSAELTAKNAALEASQTEVRVMAATAERERIARDLHDLLGHTLTVVAVKADLAARLIDIDTARAKAEIKDLQATARTALADIRSAVTGMRRVALGAELAQARHALAAVDTTLAVTSPEAALPAPVEEALAMMLREGATNVVRHAHATRCDVAIAIDGEDVRFTLADNGIGGPIREGNGLAGMRARVAALGGKLTVDGEKGMRIEAVLPLRRVLA